MAMGKLGGEELNFSSDVDVCYFYSTDAGAAGEASLHEYYAELSRRVSAALEQPTGDGMVFRVDLRLRPEGRNGPLCNSLAAAETLLRDVRAHLGAAGAGCARGRRRGIGRWARSCCRSLEPFIYPRSVDARLIDDVRGLRALFRDPADAGGALGETGFDVKLGAGGIRDVEMVVQALQLLNAGKRPDLRERNTPRAFPRLVVAGLLGDREAWTLLSAYRFWRRLEHRVQVATGAQHHRLPGRRRGARALRRGARVSPAWRRSTPRCGTSARRSRRSPRRWASRRRRWTSRRRACWIRCATASSWSGWRRRPASATPRRPPTRWRRSGRACRRRCWGRSIASPDPDRALLHFRDLIWRSSDALMLLLRDEPQLARMLAALFGTSDRLADLLVRHPPMWDALVEGLGARVRTHAELRRGCAGSLPRAGRATPR